MKYKVELKMVGDNHSKNVAIETYHKYSDGKLFVAEVFYRLDEEIMIAKECGYESVDYDILRTMFSSNERQMMEELMVTFDISSISIYNVHGTKVYY